MKRIKWNIGIMIIRIGYLIRKYQKEPLKYSIRWEAGRIILKFGYLLRGEIPMRTWKWNHI
ncbi:hypothetical protein LCGC14_1312360 [marine sediment metagenome]|uniref:Uncharacterized protein n=1 Tax=marine sediment metagenome TaxID=412755 RepID=A0A0F9KMG1_9ZZZZ|nr:hypothetical protein [bacterium]